MSTVNFIVQVDNEADTDRCRYALVSLDEATLRKRLGTVESMNGADPHFEGAMFSGGLVHAHFLDASFPVSRSDELPEGQEPFLSADEEAAFDTEGWASVPASLAASAQGTMSGFIEEVEDVRVLVTPAGLQVCASHVGFFVRSWTVPWDVLPAQAAP